MYENSYTNVLLFFNDTNTEKYKVAFSSSNTDNTS